MLELGSIDELLLYIDKETDITKEDENQITEIKRVVLDRDLEIGETAYTHKDKNNKVIKHDENKYVFYRFDEIQSHIEDYDSEYNIEDIRDSITYNFDYNLEYASERVLYLEEMIDDNSWIYDLVSSNRIIKKEQKKASSFLGENQRLDSYLQRMADYMLHPKFNDIESEGYFNGLKEELDFLNKKKGKSNAEIAEQMEVRNEIDLINHGIMTTARINRNHKKENSIDDFSILEATENFTKEFDEDKSRSTNVGKELEIDDGYWERMGFSKEGAQLRRDVINTYEEALKPLIKQLGHGEPAEEKKVTRCNTIANLDSIKYFDSEGKERVITPTSRFNGLNKMYNELKSDFRRAREILATPIHFTQVAPSSTKFNYNFDTWYEDGKGKMVEVSKNTVLLNNPNTYKGLIANYYNLKDKYEDDFQDDMWYILMVFEDLIKQTNLNKEERFVLDRVMRDFFRNEILEDFEREFGKNISMRTISNWTNRVIPNKLLNTYMESVNEWLYTYKLRGKFKRCSKCGEIKTINNNRFFSADNRNKDGFRSICKKCR